MATEERRDFNSVRISKAKLLKVLAQNKAAHVEEYRKALDGWVEKVMGMAQAVSVASNPDDAQNRARRLYHEHKPTSHEDDYDRIIDLLEASMDEEFVISASDFAKYYRDDCGWKSTFSESVSRYGGQ